MFHDDHPATLAFYADNLPQKAHLYHHAKEANVNGDQGLGCVRVCFDEGSVKGLRRV